MFYYVLNAPTCFCHTIHSWRSEFQASKLCSTQGQRPLQWPLGGRRGAFDYAVVDGRPSRSNCSGNTCHENFSEYQLISKSPPYQYPQVQDGRRPYWIWDSSFENAGESTKSWQSSGLRCVPVNKSKTGSWCRLVRIILPQIICFPRKKKSDSSSAPWIQSGCSKFSTGNMPPIIPHTVWSKLWLCFGPCTAEENPVLLSQSQKHSQFLWFHEFTSIMYFYHQKMIMSQTMCSCEDVTCYLPDGQFGVDRMSKYTMENVRGCLYYL